jgi:outer membrane putative beta-barrel porin/alpha-amylase
LQYEVSLRTRHPLLPTTLATLVVVGLSAGSARAQTAQATAEFDSLRQALGEAARVLGSQQSASTIVALTSIEVATAPLGTSTGGFTFTFDPLLQVYRRSASSFGPSFAERALTAGRAKVSLGGNWVYSSYDSLGEFSLEGNELQLAKNVNAPALPRVASTALNVNLDTHTIAGFAQVGVTDRFDIGAIVPWVRVALSADGLYLGPSGSTEGTLSVPRARAWGIGDMGIFGKYLLWQQSDGGLAAAFDVRLPTGDEDELRGLGITRTTAALVWSKGGRVSPHANFGFEFWSKEVPISASGDVSIRHQVKYAAGLEIDAHPQLTVLVDFVGRQLLGGGKLEYQTFTAPGGTGTVDALVGQAEGISSFWIVPGAKWNIWRRVLLTANVLTSLASDGLRAKITPVAGIDWSF